MKIDFRLFITVSGITGSSGLIYENDELWLISDDSYVLYHYDLKGNTLDRVNLHPNLPIKENMVKTEKPDFESVIKAGRSLFIFGSGSVGQRYFMAEVDSVRKQMLKLQSLELIYQKIANECGIGAEDFNIEGVVLDQNKAFFFNRGNGPNQKNGVIGVTNWPDESRIQSVFSPVLLPKINQVPMGFTDAVLVGDKIYFIATAEDTASTFDDGEILGSGLGVLSYPDFKLLDFKLITHDYKLEGITLYSQHSDRLTFLLCEDADDGVPETKVFIVEIGFG